MVKLNTMNYRIEITIEVNGNIEALKVLNEFRDKIGYVPIYENLGEHSANENIPGTGTMFIKEVNNG